MSSSAPLPSSSKSWLSKPGYLGAAARAGVLTGALSLLLVVAGMIGFVLYDATGLNAACVSMLACLASGLLAMFSAEFARQFNQPLGGMLVAMGIRTSVPMAVLLAVYYRGGPMVDAGMAFYMLVFYLAVLALETFMDVNVLKTSQRAAKA